MVTAATGICPGSYGSFKAGCPLGGDRRGTIKKQRREPGKENDRGRRIASQARHGHSQSLQGGHSVL